MCDGYTVGPESAFGRAKDCVVHPLGGRRTASFTPWADEGPLGASVVALRAPCKGVVHGGGRSECRAAPGAASATASVMVALDENLADAHLAVDRTLVAFSTGPENGRGRAKGYTGRMPRLCYGP